MMISVSPGLENLITFPAALPIAATVTFIAESDINIFIKQQ